MSNDFHERDYPPYLISKHVDTINTVPQVDACKPMDKNAKPKYLPYVSTFSDLKLAR